MKSIFLLCILSLPRILMAQETGQADALVEPKIALQEITVGGPDADVRGFDNQAIQYAIDAVSKTGGTVFLESGAYHITAPVRLKSRVNLIGTGKETILKRSHGVQTSYVVDADYGELKLTVENPDGFEIGMKVQGTGKTTILPTVATVPGSWCSDQRIF